MTGEGAGSTLTVTDDAEASRFGLDVASASAAERARAIDVVAAADAGIAAARLMSRLGRWVEQLGRPFAAAHVPPCCLFAAYATPWLAAPDGLLVAKTAMWTTAFDGFADDLDGTCALDFAATIRSCQGVLLGERDAGAPALVNALAELDDAIAAARPDDELHAWWRDAALRFLDGVQFERDASLALAGGESGPPLHEYLRQATESIGLQLVTIAACAGTAARCVAEAATFRRALRDASLVVRLANDLRGHDRERAEGVVDAMTLGMSADAVGDLLAETLQRCLRTLAGLTSQPAAMLVERQLLWSLRSYQRSNTIHESAEDVR